MLRKVFSRKFRDSYMTNIGSLNSQELENKYGKKSMIFNIDFDNSIYVCSQNKDFDLVELEQLLQSVGWSRRPLRRVKRALDNSLLKVGLWKHDKKFPRLVGFARCTGDGILEATVWDVAVHPVCQGSGLGTLLMEYILESLRDMGLERVTLFADPGVITFYERQGWILEPNKHRCAFWYAN